MRRFQRNTIASSIFSRLEEHLQLPIDANRSNPRVELPIRSVQNPPRLARYWTPQQQRVDRFTTAR